MYLPYPSHISRSAFKNDIEISPPPWLGLTLPVEGKSSLADKFTSLLEKKKMERKKKQKQKNRLRERKHQQCLQLDVHCGKGNRAGREPPMPKIATDIARNS